MPKHIIKPHPEIDFYVVWSTIVEAPVAAGTKAELIAAGPRNEMDPERFLRADTRGTSAMWPSIQAPYGGWGSRLMYEQRGSIPPSLLPELCSRIEREADVTDLLEPIDG